MALSVRIEKDAAHHMTVFRIASDFHFVDQNRERMIHYLTVDKPAWQTLVNRKMETYKQLINCLETVGPLTFTHVITLDV